MSICVGATSNDLGKLPLLLDGRWVGVEAAKLCIFYNQSAWVAVFFLFYFIVVPPLFIYFLTAFVFGSNYICMLEVENLSLSKAACEIFVVCLLRQTETTNTIYKKKKGWSKVGFLGIRWGKNKCGSATLFDLLIGSFRIPGKSAFIWVPFKRGINIS